MKLLHIGAIVCIPLAVPYLLLAFIGPPPLDLVPLGIPACLLGFVVPRGRLLLWGAAVVAAGLFGLYQWLDYTVQQGHEGIGVALGASMTWVFALLTAGCFGVVLLLRIARDAVGTFLGRPVPGTGEQPSRD